MADDRIAMAQQPKIELEFGDLPRARMEPMPARPWRPNRPGDFSGPGDVPAGPGFGTPGPDTGYALRLLAERDLDLEPDEDIERVRAAAINLVSARAAHFGRAPSRSDIDAVLALMGLHADVTGTFRSALGADRRRWVKKAAHGAMYGRALVAAVDDDLLYAPVEEIVDRLRSGVRPLPN